MKIISRLALLFSVLYFAVRTFADVTPSSALLLKSADATPTVNLESGRYVVKSETKVVASEATEDAAATPAPVAPAVPPKPIVKKVAKKIETPKAPAAVDPKAPITEENFVQRLQSVLLGDQDETLRYRESLHPDDRRQNMIEVQVAPTLMYLDSNSSYSYRNYSSSGSGLGIGAQIWTTPFFGITSSYFVTLASDMSASVSGDRQLQVDHRFFDVGIKYRKFFTLSRRSPVTGVSLKYDEYQLNFPKKEAGRTRLKTTGVALGFDAKIPSSFTHAWTFGTDIIIRPTTTEEKTALNLKSGKNPTAQTFKAFVGSEYSFSRNQSLYWKLSHRLDKTVYEDSANQADPNTGATPSGVSVNQGVTMFELGFTFGG